MRETMVEICYRRVRANPVLTLYEHEISKLAHELAGSTRDGRPTAGEIEIDIRSGYAKFCGRPIRLSQPRTAPSTP